VTRQQDYRIRIVWLSDGDELVFATSPRLTYRFARACLARAKRPDSEILDAWMFNVKHPPPAPEGVRCVRLPLDKYEVIAIDREGDS